MRRRLSPDGEARVVCSSARSTPCASAAARMPPPDSDIPSSLSSSRLPARFSTDSYLYKSAVSPPSVSVDVLSTYAQPLDIAMAAIATNRCMVDNIGLPRAREPLEQLLTMFAAAARCMDIAIEAHRHHTRLDYSRPPRTWTRRAVHSSRRTSASSVMPRQRSRSPGHECVADAGAVAAQLLRGPSAVSALFLTTCASAASMTACGVWVRSAA